VQLSDRYDGSADPFEGERTILWRGVPADAVITAATLTLAPVRPPGSATYTETLRLDAAGPAYGATIEPAGSAVLIDFHARRAATSIGPLPSVTGPSLLVDIGGGVFLTVGAVGAIPAPPGPAFDYSTGVLPGVAALRLRLNGNWPASSDLAGISLGIATMPSNLTLRFGKQPPFFIHTGQLAVATSTPDIAQALQRALTEAPLTDGFYAIPLVVHSDTLGRLTIVLEVTYLGSAPLLPAGLREVVLPFDLASVTTTAANALQASLPAGAVIQAPQTALAVRGAFEASRVAYGPTGQTQAAPPLSCAAAATLAQAVIPAADTSVSGLDLYVAADGPAARLAFDLRMDADGKPGPQSLLAKPLPLNLAGDPTGQLRWVTVTAQPPALLRGGTMYWLVAQALDGTARLGTDPARDAMQAAATPPQRSADSGFSWRRAGEATALLVRLRTVPDRFRMPIDFTASSSAQTRRVSLAAYEPLGKIDMVLDRPEIAGAVGAVLAQALAPPCAAGERLQNPDFNLWTAQCNVLAPVPVGSSLSGDGIALIETFFGQQIGTMTADLGVITALAFAADGAALFVAGSAHPSEIWVLDPLGGGARPLVASSLGTPAILAATSPTITALAMDDRNGRLLALETDLLVSIDPVTGSRGASWAVPNATALAIAPGGTLAYVAGNPAVVAIDITTWRPAFQVTLTAPFGIAVSADGGTLAVIDAARIRTFDAATGAAGWSAALPSVQTSLAVGFAAHGGGVYVVGGMTPPGTTSSHAVLCPFDARGRAGSTVDLTMPTLAASGGRLWLAVKPQGDRVYVATTPAALDTAGARLAVAISHTDLRSVAVGQRLPVGWALTAGQVDAIPAADPAVMTRAIMAQLIEGALSQVCPISAACLHDLSVTAISVTGQRFAPGDAVAELFWYGANAALLRTDTMALPVSSVAATQRRRLTPPASATQVELRVSVTGGAVGLLRASLRSTDAMLLADAWRPDPALSGRLVAVTGSAATTWHNLGADDGALSQTATVAAGVPLELQFSGAVVAGAPVLGVQFRDAAGTDIGSTATIPLDVTAFALRRARLNVPDSAAAAVLRIALPAGAVLKVARLELLPRPGAVVACGFIAQSPGELHVSAARIVYDVPDAAPPPIPSGGLLPPTPPGRVPGTGGEDGCSCAPAAPVQGTLPAIPHPQPTPPQRLPVAQPAPAIDPALAIGAVPTIDPVPAIGDVPGIGPSRARRLAEAGITTVAALAAAAPEQVLAAVAGPGASPALAAALIENARVLRDRLP
jgi:hypothetical protein